ncbi:MAG: hypothetical protein C4560_00335 [Nitrospiraceae bacterium]|nr:MAG: hypothetical protein C4560_00335 [Nitrospiraceae bacterium]
MPADVFAFPYQGIDLKINSSIAETYDDNINFSKNEKEEDFITELLLGIDARYEGKRRFLNLGGNINQRFHFRFPDIKSSSENIRLNFRNEFSEYDTLQLNYNYSHSQAPESFEDEFGRVETRRSSYKNAFDAIYYKQFSERLNSSFRYIYSLSIVPEETSSDSSLNGIGLNLNYLHNASSTLYISYDFSDIKYKGGGNISFQILAAGFKKYITRQLFLDGRVGIDIVDPDIGQGYITESYDVSLTDEIDRNTVMKLSFQRSDEATSEREDIFRNWQLTGNVTREFTDKVAGSIEVFYGKGKYVTLSEGSTFLGASTNFAYNVTERLSGKAGYRYSNRDSTIDTEYTRNTASIGLSYIF